MLQHGHGRHRFEPEGASYRYRTSGHREGPITRLMSPGDIGELVKPFVFRGR